MRRGNGREKSEKAHILDVVRYFSLFQYAPTEAQIRQFLPIKVSSARHKAILDEMVQAKKLVKGDFGMPPQSIYAVGGHSIFTKKRIVRKAQTDRKIERLQIYSRILYMSPWIKMVGISGSCSMENAKASDDVDFFIISAKNRLWSARIWAICAAKLLGVHRSRKARHVSGKACLNMFFDEQDLSVPQSKQTLYTAHEVVQMRCIDMREGAYYHRLFMRSNAWIKSYFPNLGAFRSKQDIYTSQRNKNLITGIVGGIFEQFVKAIQLSIMVRHISKETITDTQLWFFPKDFSNRITHHLEATSSRFR